MTSIDWPESALAVAAIRPVLRARLRRAMELADALRDAGATSRWHGAVLAAVEDARASMSRDAARRLVETWDRDRPPSAPPASVALAPWATTDRSEPWSPEQLRDAARRLRAVGSATAGRIADLVERWARQSGDAVREWWAAATALARWALARFLLARPSQPSETNWVLVAALAAVVLLWGGRRGR